MLWNSLTWRLGRHGPGRSELLSHSSWQRRLRPQVFLLAGCQLSAGVPARCWSDGSPGPGSLSSLLSGQGSAGPPPRNITANVYHSSNFHIEIYFTSKYLLFDFTPHTTENKGWKNCQNFRPSLSSLSVLHLHPWSTHRSLFHGVSKALSSRHLKITYLANVVIKIFIITNSSIFMSFDFSFKCSKFPCFPHNYYVIERSRRCSSIQ